MNEKELANAKRIRSLVGGLIYLMTRLDIVYHAGLISRFMQQTSKVHYGEAKRVLRYIIGTLTLLFGTRTLIISDCAGTQIVIGKVHWTIDRVFRQMFLL